MVLDTSWNRTTIEFGHKGVTPVHITALFMGSINCILNSLICIAFRRSPKLLTKHHLHLFYAFAITNFLTGFFTIPTYINLFYKNNLNCPRWSILIGSSFEIALDKIRHIITLSIAGERIYALFRPGDYFFLDHRAVAMRVCFTATAWGAFDMMFLILEDDIFSVRVHCVTTSSSGPLFHVYFLLSTISFGILLSFAYFMFICKLFVLRGTRVINTRSSRENFHQVNSLTIMVILMVVVFNVMPSLLYLYDMVVGEVHFMKWGPIITIGCHCYGCLSFFLYNCRHREIRTALNKVELIRRFVNCEKESSKTTGCNASAQYSYMIRTVPHVTSKICGSKPPSVVTPGGIRNENEVFL